LYASDVPYPDSIPVGKGVAVSSAASLLQAIARGEGPKKMMIALGYAGWGPGQLEAEMRRGDWFTAPASVDILFDDHYPTKWKRAMERRFRTL
jgi:putative transcriptional regulator